MSNVVQAHRPQWSWLRCRVCGVEMQLYTDTDEVGLVAIVEHAKKMCDKMIAFKAVHNADNHIPNPLSNDSILEEAYAKLYGTGPSKRFSIGAESPKRSTSGS